MTRSSLMHHMGIILANLDEDLLVKAGKYVESLAEGRERLDLYVDPAIQEMLPQAFICLIERLGGSVTLPGVEIDETGQKMMYMEIINGEAIRFYTGRKS